MLGKERSWWWYDYSMNTISHDSETPAQGQQVITACAFLHHSFDGSMKVFLPKRADTKKFLPGIYELPGGHIDFGEDLIAGLKREVQEEFGLKCSVGDPCAAFTYTNEVKGSHSIEVIFFAQFTDPIENIKLNPEDHSEYGWFAVDKLYKTQSEKKGNGDPEQIAMLKAFKMLAGNSPDFS